MVIIQNETAFLLPSICLVKKAHYLYLLLLNIHDKGSIACDLLWFFFRSPLEQHISKGEQVS